jgi:hypothetical protein
MDAAVSSRNSSKTLRSPFLKSAKSSVLCQNLNPRGNNSRFLLDNNVDLNSLGKNGIDADCKDGFPVYEKALVVIDLIFYRSFIFKHHKLVKIPRLQEILGDLGYDKNDFAEGVKSLVVLDIYSSKRPDNSKEDNGIEKEVVNLMFCFDEDHEVIYTAEVLRNF